MYLLTPYLLTAAVSVAGPLAVSVRPTLYQAENLIWWEAALAAAMIAAAVEFALNVKNMEELQWN